MSTDSRLERLFELLPAVYRSRDEGVGGPLQQLLRVLTEQMVVLEDDTEQLYDNWFIETAQDWAVPYIGDLVGYTPVHEAGDPGQASTALNRILFPRSEVANTIRARRRKGTLALLETLASDVAGWSSRTVEFSQLVVQTPHMNHLHLRRGRSVDVRRGQALDLLGSPFDPLPHTADVRRIGSPHTPGRFNLPSVGLFVWRLRACPVTRAPAACLEEVSPSCYTFSVLGQDAPLFTKPEPEPGPDHIADEVNLPVPIRRRALARHLKHYYGEGRSFVIYRGRKQGARVELAPVSVRDLVVADLSGWEYRPRRGQVAVDPQLGRLAFHPRDLPAGVWVSYHSGFSADLGGGEYRRPGHPAPDDRTFYRQVSKAGEVSTLEQGVKAWRAETPARQHAVLEITDSELYSEQLNITLAPGEHLELRAASGTRPVIYLLDRERNLPDALTVIGEVPADAGPGGGERCLGRLTLEGLLITGRAVHVEGALAAVCIRHCTLVPGWGLTSDCHPLNPAKPSLEIYHTQATVHIEHSILGSIQVEHDEVSADPTVIHLSDSILDATSDRREAVGAPNWPKAHATLQFRRCTVIGEVQCHAVTLAENSIFLGDLRVARRQLGCMRFCTVTPQSRTPRRYHCQPDLVEAALKGRPDWTGLASAEQARRIHLAGLRVQPQFDCLHYGTPTYARLRLNGPPEIARGADDEAEMGVFHDLFQPQRLINLNTRLQEYTPARTDAGVLFTD